MIVCDPANQGMVRSSGVTCKEAKDDKHDRKGDIGAGAKASDARDSDHIHPSSAPDRLRNHAL
jgi:hypothetical protein